MHFMFISQENTHLITNVGGLPAMELNGVLEEKIEAKIPRFRSPKLVVVAKRVETEDRWER